MVKFSEQNGVKDDFLEPTIASGICGQNFVRRRQSAHGQVGAQSIQRLRSNPLASNAGIISFFLGGIFLRKSLFPLDDNGDGQHHEREGKFGKCSFGSVSTTVYHAIKESQCHRFYRPSGVSGELQDAAPTKPRKGSEKMRDCSSGH